MAEVYLKGPWDDLRQSTDSRGSSPFKLRDSQDEEENQVATVQEIANVAINLAQLNRALKSTGQDHIRRKFEHSNRDSWNAYDAEERIKRLADFAPGDDENTWNPRSVRSWSYDLTIAELVSLRSFLLMQSYPKEHVDVRRIDFAILHHDVSLTTERVRKQTNRSIEAFKNWAKNLRTAHLKQIRCVIKSSVQNDLHRDIPLAGREDVLNWLNTAINVRTAYRATHRLVPSKGRGRLISHSRLGLWDKRSCEKTIFRASQLIVTVMKNRRKKQFAEAQRAIQALESEQKRLMTLLQQCNEEQIETGPIVNAIGLVERARRKSDPDPRDLPHQERIKVRQIGLLEREKEWKLVTDLVLLCEKEPIQKIRKEIYRLVDKLTFEQCSHLVGQFHLANTPDNNTTKEVKEMLRLMLTYEDSYNINQALQQLSKTIEQLWYIGENFKPLSMKLFPDFIREQLQDIQNEKNEQIVIDYIVHAYTYGELLELYRFVLHAGEVSMNWGAHKETIRKAMQAHQHDRQPDLSVRTEPLLLYVRRWSINMTNDQLRRVRNKLDDQGSGAPSNSIPLYGNRDVMRCLDQILKDRLSA